MHFTEPLLSFIRNDQNTEAKSILKYRRLDHPIDTEGTTLLHYAAEHNNSVITQYLLKRGSDVNARDSSGKTPLMTAVEKGHGPAICYLLHAKADVDVKNNFGHDALDFALNQPPSNPIHGQLLHALRKKHPSDEIAERLLTHHRNLGAAVYSRDAKIVEYMIERGVPVNLPGQFPLHSAVWVRDADMVEMLLKHGADVEAIDGEGATPLNYLYDDSDFYYEEKKRILGMLLDKGVTLTTCTSSGYFNIRSALIEGDREVIRAILPHIDFTARQSFDGATVLHVLMCNKGAEVDVELEAYADKCDVDVEDRHGYKVLTWAASEGHVAMVKLLLRRGAKADGVALASAFAAEHKRSMSRVYDRCVKILLDHGADPRVIFTGGTVDVALKNKRYSRVEFALAKLAIIERQGVAIEETVYLKINSNGRLKGYLQRCKRLLKMIADGNVTFFDLLTVDEDEMIKYMNNDELVLKLARAYWKPQLRKMFSYYYNRMYERCSDCLRGKKLRYGAAKIICEVFGNRLGLRDIPTEMVIDCLGDDDLRLMCSFDDEST